MTNPSEQFLFFPPSAAEPGIFSPILSSSGPDPRPGSCAKPHKRRSRMITIGHPSSLGLTSPYGSPRPKKYSGRRPDPDAPKITRPCSECGKTFWSWKALFGHMRCHPERQWRGMNPPVNFQPRLPEEPSPSSGSDLGGWPAAMTEEEHEVAACLLMLANSQLAEPSRNASSIHEADSSGGRPPEPGPCLGMDDTGHLHQHPHHLQGHFECSSCKKVFGSHQALGGHRASHKNVKGCFANAMMKSSSLGCCENTMVFTDSSRKSEFRDCEDSGASPNAQLTSNCFAKMEVCDVDLSLRLGL